MIYDDYEHKKKIVAAIVSSLVRSKHICSIGLEREGLRVTRNGHLSQTLHPAEFGEKLENKHIKTDFCESQPELVTSPKKSVAKTYQKLEKLIDTLNQANSKNDELFWTQSMPCILPDDDDDIKTAIHNTEFSAPLRQYLVELRKKYGPKSQLLSGIHYNFSFSDEFWDNFTREMGCMYDIQQTKNIYYMIMIKNYMRYSWLIVLLTGCSPALHESFDKTLDCLSYDKRGFYIGKNAVSLRMSEIGYHNKTNAKIDYTNVKTYANSLKKAVEKGKLIDSGELFAPIKPKVSKFTDPVKGLKTEGIKYLELRNIDVNMFDKCGISEEDMEFISLFMVFMILLECNEYQDWQKDAHNNMILVATNGRCEDITLTQSGAELSMSSLINNVLAYMTQMNKTIKLCSEQTIKSVTERLKNPKKSHSALAYQEFIKNGFVETNIEFAKKFSRLNNE